MTEAMEFSLNASPSHLLHRAQQFAALQSAAALSEAGITLRQFSVLAAISENEGASQSRLVGETGIDRSTLADMVQRMERGGFIRRAASKEDARAKAVFLTAKGRRVFDKTGPAVQEADAQLLAALPKNRRTALISILIALSGATEEPVVNGAAGADETVEEPAPKKAKTEKKPKVKKAKAEKDEKPVKKTKTPKKGGKKKSSKK